MTAEIVRIQLKILLLFQRIIDGLAASQRYFSFVFGIGGTENHCFFRCICLNHQGDQLGGAVSDNDIFVGGARVLCDHFSKVLILPVRIGLNDVDMLTDGFPKIAGDSEWIDVGGKAGDLFLWDMVDLFYFFQVASVKMILVLQGKLSHR